MKESNQLWIIALLYVIWSCIESSKAVSFLALMAGAATFLRCLHLKWKGK